MSPGRATDVGRSMQRNVETCSNLTICVTLTFAVPCFKIGTDWVWWSTCVSNLVPGRLRLWEAELETSLGHLENSKLASHHVPQSLGLRSRVNMGYFFPRDPGPSKLNLPLLGTHQCMVTITPCWGTQAWSLCISVCPGTRKAYPLSFPTNCTGAVIG